MSFLRRSKAAHPAVKQVKSLLKAVQKNKKLPNIEVASRQEIVSRIFEERMHAVGLEPVDSTGHIPISSTPLARYLRGCGLNEDIVDAIISGILEEESEESVREIISAAAETPDITLTDRELSHAQELAVEEWRRKQKTMSI